MKNLQANEVQEVLQGNAIVDFYADWCGPCKYMKPYFEGAEEKIGALGFRCYEINVDDCDEFAGKNKIQFIPCVIMFKDGKEVARFTGAKEEEGILAFVRENADK